MLVVRERVESSGTSQIITSLLKEVVTMFREFFLDIRVAVNIRRFL